MRYVHVLSLALALACACTRPNPDRCCSDTADCTANDIPEANICGAGTTCTDHNTCVADQCTTSAGCSAAAPYCATDAGDTCATKCTGDDECPGFGQDASDKFCVGGGCVQCRADMNDCPTATPICSMAGACGKCTAHDQCTSGACATDGSCVDPSQIAYVSLTGSATGSCSQAAPCNSVAYALAQTTAPFIVISPATYTSTAALSISSARTLIGSGSGATLLRSSAIGAIVSVTSTGAATLDHLDLGSAFGTGSSIPAENGHGVMCAAGGSLSIDQSSIHDNADIGLLSNCATAITRTAFLNNGAQPIVINAAPFSCDQCSVGGGPSQGVDGIDCSGGPTIITNSFIFRNGPTAGGEGIFFSSSNAGNLIEFNTIVDNSTGIECDATPASVTIRNNIIARNSQAQTSTSDGCGFTDHNIIQNDVSGLNFKSPDLAPYDYHLLHGSSAIDGAATSTVDHDFDGDHRPMGSASDIGADEAE